MSNRALIIAFHFPPQAGSSGIQRTLSFSKHLGSLGWQPLVLSAQPIAYGEKNPSQLKSVPASLTVRRAFSLDTKRHLGLFGRYPELLALPDRWMSWWFFAVPAGLSLIRRHKPAVIWSTFPIATSHLIGLTLHRLTGIPWVADFRDPMLQPAHPSSRWQRNIYAWIEKQTITHCRKAIFTTQSALNAYRVRFPALPRDKFVVIENGYDEEGFGGMGVIAAASLTSEKPVTLLHSGVLYAEGRNPSAFFEAISKLKANGRASHASLSVILRATGDDARFIELTKRHGVDDIVRIEPPVPYRKALQEMLKVDGLLVFQGTQFNTQVPAKIYEYFRASKPILGLVDPAGETARILAAAGFRDMAPMNSADRIATTLGEFLENVRTGKAYVAGHEVIEAASRQRRTAELARVFSEVCSKT